MVVGGIGGIASASRDSRLRSMRCRLIRRRCLATSAGRRIGHGSPHTGLGRFWGTGPSALGRMSARAYAPQPATLSAGSGARSVHVDVLDLDRVVPVAEAVPRRDVWLHVAGYVGRSRAKRVPPDSVGVPSEGPVLPLVGALGFLELSGVPVAFTGEADVHLGDGSGAGPGFAA